MHDPLTRKLLAMSARIHGMGNRWGDGMTESGRDRLAKISVLCELAKSFEAWARGIAETIIDEIPLPVERPVPHAARARPHNALPFLVITLQGHPSQRMPRRCPPLGRSVHAYPCCVLSSPIRLPRPEKPSLPPLASLPWCPAGRQSSRPQWAASQAERSLSILESASHPACLVDGACSSQRFIPPHAHAPWPLRALHGLSPWLFSGLLQAERRLARHVRVCWTAPPRTRHEGEEGLLKGPVSCLASTPTSLSGGKLSRQSWRARRLSRLPTLPSAHAAVTEATSSR